MSRRGDAILELVLALEVVLVLERTGHGTDTGRTSSDVVGHANRLEGWNGRLLILLLMDDHGTSVDVAIDIYVDAGGSGWIIEKRA